MSDECIPEIEQIIGRALDVRPGTAMPAGLLKYWLTGAGAAKIGWGVGGDFNRCREQIQKEVSEKGPPLSPHIIDGLCATLHKMATGATPGHAPGETHSSSHGHRFEIVRLEGRSMADAKKPYGDVTYADPGYQKDGVKRYPIHTKENAKAAWSYINQPDNAAKYSPSQVASIKSRIKAALTRFGVQTADDSRSTARQMTAWITGATGWVNGIPVVVEAPTSRSGGALMDVPSPAAFAPVPFTRSYPLEDISIRSGGDGRTVEAYAAVFDVPTTIHDQDGDYSEVLDRAAFNKAIGDSAPAGSRKNWRVGVFYNHGMTLHGTPSDRHSMPVGSPVEIRVEPRGLLTVTQYNRSELADEILENIRSGGISGYSFSGAFKRSSPVRPRGGYQPDSRGNLITVRRMESTLREYGPTPFPAYQEASIVGMRTAQVLATLNPDELAQLVALYRSYTPEAESDESGTSMQEAATEEPPAEQAGHSGRPMPPKSEMRKRRSQWLQRYGENNG